MTTRPSRQSPDSPSPPNRPTTWVELISQVVKSRTQTRHMIALVRSTILAIFAGVAIVAAVILSVALAAKNLPVFEAKGLHTAGLGSILSIVFSALSLLTFIIIGVKKLIRKRNRAPSATRRTSRPPSQECRELDQTPPTSPRLRHTRPRFGPYRL